MKSFKLFLFEKYFSRSKLPGSEFSYEIFKNPSKQELKQLGTDYRFLIFPNGNLYVANAFKSLHQDMLNKIKENKQGMVATMGWFLGGDLTMRLAPNEMKQTNLDIEDIRKMLSTNKILKRLSPNWYIG